MLEFKTPYLVILGGLSSDKLELVLPVSVFKCLNGWAFCIINLSPSLLNHSQPRPHSQTLSLSLLLLLLSLPIIFICQLCRPCLPAICTPNTTLQPFFKSKPLIGVSAYFFIIIIESFFFFLPIMTPGSLYNPITKRLLRHPLLSTLGQRIRNCIIRLPPAPHLSPLLCFTEAQPLHP